MRVRQREHRDGTEESTNTTTTASCRVDAGVQNSKRIGTCGCRPLNSKKLESATAKGPVKPRVISLHYGQSNTKRNPCEVPSLSPLVNDQKAYLGRSFCHRTLLSGEDNTPISLTRVSMLSSFGSWASVFVMMAGNAWLFGGYIWRASSPCLRERIKLLFRTSS